MKKIIVIAFLICAATLNAQTSNSKQFVDQLLLKVLSEDFDKIINDHIDLLGRPLPEGFQRNPMLGGNSYSSTTGFTIVFLQNNRIKEVIFEPLFWLKESADLFYSTICLPYFQNKNWQNLGRRQNTNFFSKNGVFIGVLSPHQDPTKPEEVYFNRILFGRQ